MKRIETIQNERQTGLASATTVIASLLLAILFLNPNTAFAKIGDACKTDANCTTATEKCDISTLKCIVTSTPPPATFKATCKDVIFSDGTDNYGCIVAAALDWSMPRTVETVEAKVGKMTKGQLDRYNAALESLVRRECWKTFDYLLSKVKIFGEKDSSDKTGKTYKVAPMTVAELKGFLQEDAQRLDVMAVGRHPKGPKGDQGDTGPQGDPGPTGTCPTCPAPPASGPVK